LNEDIQIEKSGYENICTKVVDLDAGKEVADRDKNMFTKENN